MACPGTVWNAHIGWQQVSGRCEARCGPWGGDSTCALLRSSLARFEGGFHLNHPSIQLLPHAKHCSRHWKYSSEQHTDPLAGDKRQVKSQQVESC